MMRNEKKIIMLLITLFLFVFLNTFFINKIININIGLIIVLLTFLIIVYIMLGNKKNNNPNIFDVGQIIFIYSFIYIILSYLSGLFLGFVRSPYSLNIIKIISNILPCLILILFEEKLREMIMVNTKKDNVINFLVVIIFSFIQISTSLDNITLQSGMDVFELIGTIILPSIAQNALFTYIVINSGLLPNIIFRCIFELYTFCVPIVPDLGIYLESVLKLILPTLIFLYVNTMFAKKIVIINNRKKITRFILTTPILTLLIVTIALISNIFRYNIIAIGSNSMKSKISKGDAVILEKIKEENQDEIEVGDVLVFSHDNKIIVHRVIKIQSDKDGYIFNTKGDNNESADNYNVYSDEVVGKVDFVIPIIGYPTVWLTERMNK